MLSAIIIMLGTILALISIATVVFGISCLSAETAYGIAQILLGLGGIVAAFFIIKSEAR